jgi:hypothetical protein
MIRTHTPTEAREHFGALTGILTDCGDGGASVSFMALFVKDESRDVLPQGNRRP